jgi:dihydrofolate reductase
MNKRKIILNLATSLDWFIEWKNWEYDWCFTDQDYGFKDFIESIDTIFMWKKSYELFKTDVKSNFPWKKIIVFSTTLQDDSIEIIRENIREYINKLKSEEWKNIWMFGWAKLSESFMRLELIDEIQMAVHPLILWGWTPLFHRSDKRIKLELIENTDYSSWMVILKYDVKY